jgi:two-component system, cell cycle response regulator DivK
MAKKILIAEDSSVIQNLARKVLEFQNFEILIAKNGQKVLEILENEHIDAILMDINMPLMNGIDCTKQIRTLANESKANVPIIAITGNAQNYRLEEYIELGFSNFLPKPINFDVLVEMVKKVMK